MAAAEQEKWVRVARLVALVGGGAFLASGAYVLLATILWSTSRLTLAVVDLAFGVILVIISRTRALFDLVTRR